MSENAFRLEDHGEDLCALARAGSLDPLGGRGALLQRLSHVLARKTKRNPLLLGEPGVGKSALVEGLAQRIVAGEVPAHLAGRRIFSLSLGSLLGGTSYRGDFEKRLELMIRELLDPSARWLLFIDELHLLLKAGRGEGGLDAANMLKPLLARGGIACIGASTPCEWRSVLRQDPALGRRFVCIEVPEPSPEEALEMLRRLRPRLEAHHGLKIDETVLPLLIAEPRRKGSHLPDCAIDRLDESCAKKRLTLFAREDEPRRKVLLEELGRARRCFDLAACLRLRRELGSVPETSPGLLLPEDLNGA